MNLDVTVHLDHPDTPIEAGQDVRGRVEIRSDTGTEVRGVTLEVAWRTEGSGNRTSGTTAELDLLAEPTRLRRGESRPLPFRFEAPPGPLSYDGRHLRVINFLRASADVAWARDPSVEVTYELRPSRKQGAGFQGPMLQIGAVAPGPTRIRAKPKPAEFLFAAAAALLGVGATVAATRVGVSTPVLVGIVVAAALGLAAALVVPFRSRIAERRLGRVELVLDETVVIPGDTIRAALSFEPRADVRIQGATAALRGRERVVRGHGKNQSVRQHSFSHVSAPLAEEMPAAAGRRVTLWAPLPVAPGCPCSFRARDNRLDWEVEVRIAVAGWPDWVAVQPVVIVPARVAVAAARG